MGEGRRRAAKETFLQQAVYDLLFQKDPPTANMFLLVLEIEDYHKSRGVKPSFGSFTGTSEQFSRFMVENKDMLLQRFGSRFPDPSTYLFPGNMKYGHLGSNFKRSPLTGKGELQ